MTEGESSSHWRPLTSLDGAEPTTSTAHGSGRRTRRLATSATSSRVSYHTITEEAISSSLALSSDTPSSSLEVLAVEPHASGDAASRAATWANSAAVPSLRELARPPSITSVSAGWRTSIDFAHQLDLKAEAELQKLWTALWFATHSQASLQTALESPQLHWNPYRPVRGGLDVRAEILNSEVVEFQAMVATDSLYLQGVGVRPPSALSLGSVHAKATRPALKANNSNAWTTPVSPAGAGELRHVESDSAPCEDVLVADGVLGCASSSPASGAAKPRDARASMSSSTCLWSARRGDAEAALFRYIWEAVVVPFYRSKPSTFFTRACSADGASTISRSLLSFAAPSEASDEKESSGVVTAFGTTRDEVRRWSYEVAQCSSSASATTISQMHSREAFRSNDAAGAPIATARATHTGPGAQVRGIHPHDFDLVSEDSLELEILDASKTSGGSSCPHGVSPAKKVEEGNVTAPKVVTASPQGCGRPRKRPSTASVHSAVATPLADAVVETPLSFLRDDISKAAQRRAVSARHDIVVSAPNTLAAQAKPPTMNVSTPKEPLFVNVVGQHMKSFSTPPAKPSDMVLEEPAVSVEAAMRPPSYTFQPPRMGEGDQTASCLMDTATATGCREPFGVLGVIQSSSKARRTRATTGGCRARPHQLIHPSSNTSGSADPMMRTRSPASPNANESAQRALQLLRLHSQSTERLLRRRRDASPVKTHGTGTYTRDSSPQDLASGGIAGVRHQRHGILSPMHLPSRGHGRQGAEQRQRSSERGRVPLLGLGTMDRMLVTPRLGPLSEITTDSAGSGRHRASPTQLPSAGNVSAGTRHSSNGPRKNEKTPLRSTSATKATPAKQLPTTARR